MYFWWQSHWSVGPVTDCTSFCTITDFSKHCKGSGRMITRSCHDFWEVSNLWFLTKNESERDGELKIWNWDQGGSIFNKINRNPELDYQSVPNHSKLKHDGVLICNCDAWFHLVIFTWLWKFHMVSIWWQRLASFAHELFLHEHRFPGTSL